MIYPVSRALRAIEAEGQNLHTTPIAHLSDTVEWDVDQWARDNGYRAELGQVVEDGESVYCCNAYLFACEDIAGATIARLLRGGGAA